MSSLKELSRLLENGGFEVTMHPDEIKSMTTKKIAVLGVAKNGIYSNDPRVIPYDIDRDLLTYRGPYRVICHTECKRWGRYWGGGPMLHGTDKQLILGDDNNMFAHALWCTRTFDGVMEHPEASHAWAWFGLPRPPRDGGWVGPDKFGGYSCCVSQGHYGHKGQKLTWLYAVGTKRPELKWGKAPGKQLMEDGYHSKAERARLRKTGICQRMSARQRAATPEEFKELLIDLVS